MPLLHPKLNVQLYPPETIPIATRARWANLEKLGMQHFSPTRNVSVLFTITESLLGQTSNMHLQTPNHKTSLLIFVEIKSCNFTYMEIPDITKVMEYLKIILHFRMSRSKKTKKVENVIV
jgi:hypothetical protein